MNIHKLLITAAVAAVPSLALSQGLMSIGRSGDFDADIPFTTTVGVGVGWDSNIGTTSENEQDSIYYQAGAGVSYGWDERRTKATLGVAGSVIMYDEVPEGLDDVDYNARVTFNLSHKLSERTTLGDTLYIAYEAQPDYDIGVSSSRRSGQYFYLSNTASLSHQWSRLVSSNHSYSLGTIVYDDGDVSAFEDRVTHDFANSLMYAYSRQTSLVLSYRLGYTAYDQLDADYQTHALLVGADHSLSRTSSLSGRVGVQFYDSDRGVEESAPYLELGYNNQISRSSGFRWYNRLGYEGTELGAFDSRYAYRTGISAYHAIDARTTFNGGINYAHTILSADSGDVDEDQIYLDLGISRRIGTNIDITAGYSFTTVDSEQDFRNFDRHRVSLGLSSTF